MKAAKPGGFYFILENYFKMQQPSTKPGFYFPTIDGLRFMAFMFVFFSHLPGFSKTGFSGQMGWLGVQLFFLLSGFLLTRLLVTEYQQFQRIHIRKYFIRRILRIWPLYFLYLLAATLAWVFLSIYPISIPRLLGNIFFYDNILTINNGFNTNFGCYHLWSISLEEQYYLILPFLVPLLTKKKRETAIRIIASIFIFLFISRFFIPFFNLSPLFISVLPFSGDSFVAGILLGLGIIDNFTKKINPFIALVAGIGLLVALHCLSFGFINNKSVLLILTYFLPAAAFFLIFIAIVYNDKGLLFRIFANKPIRYLGKISFGLYIFHLMGNFITHYFFHNLPFLLNLIISFSITLTLAVLSYELMEKRFLKAKYRFTVIKNREV